MKNLKSFESFRESLNEAKMSLWQKLNQVADYRYAEFGFATLDEDDMAEHIDMKKANAIAKKQYGEFGFATLDEEQMEEVINDNPKLVKMDTLDITEFMENNTNEGLLIESRFSDIQANSLRTARDAYLDAITKEWASIGVTVKKFNWTDRANPKDTRVPDSYKGVTADATYKGTKIEIVFSNSGQKFFLRGNEPKTGNHGASGLGYTSIKAMDKHLSKLY